MYLLRARRVLTLLKSIHLNALLSLRGRCDVPRLNPGRVKSSIFSYLFSQFTKHQFHPPHPSWHNTTKNMSLENMIVCRTSQPIISSPPTQLKSGKWSEENVKTWSEWWWEERWCSAEQSIDSLIEQLGSMRRDIRVSLNCTLVFRPDAARLHHGNFHSVTSVHWFRCHEQYRY